MKLRTFLIAGISILFGLCLALVIVSSTSAQQGLKPDKVGGNGSATAREPMTGEHFKLEYFVQNSDISFIFMYDKTTGDCWVLNREDVPWKWVSLGNPRNVAAQK